MFKKLLILSVIGFVTLPAPLAYAAVPITNPMGEIIDNVAAAESVDFSVDLDVETKSESIEEPVKFHLDLDGETDFESQSTFDLNFWSTDKHGKFSQAGSSVILASNKIYLSEDGGEWFYIELSNELTSLASEGADEENLDALKEVLQETFDLGVIEYNLETVDVVSRKLAWRYAYTINIDRLIESLVEEDSISRAQADEMSASLEHLTIGGKFWVDATEMLPVMLTLNLNSEVDANNYTNVGISVLFNDFNQEVVVDEPENALSFDEFGASQMENLVMSSLEDTAANMDTDSDGLSDDLEITVWKSSPFNTDSDGDGYPDQTEVTNGYDPNGPGRLN